MHRHRSSSRELQNQPVLSDDPSSPGTSEEKPEDNEEEEEEEGPSSWDLPSSQIVPKAGEIYWQTASPQTIAEVQARLSAAESSSPPSKRAVERVQTPVMRLRANRRSGQSLRERKTSGAGGHEAIQALRSVWQEIQEESRKKNEEQEDSPNEGLRPLDQSNSGDEEVDEDDMFLLQCSQAVDKTPNNVHRAKSRVPYVEEDMFAKSSGQDGMDMFSSRNMTSPVKMVKYPKSRGEGFKSPPPVIQYPGIKSPTQDWAEDPFGDDDDSFNEHLSQLDFNSLQSVSKGFSPRTPTSSDPNFKRFRSIEVDSPWNNAKSSSSLTSSAKSWTRSSSTPDVPNQSMPGGRNVTSQARPIYSKEEIERKRLEALKKRQQNLSKILPRKPRN